MSVTRSEDGSEENPLINETKKKDCNLGYLWPMKCEMANNTYIYVFNGAVLVLYVWL